MPAQPPVLRCLWTPAALPGSLGAFRWEALFSLIERGLGYLGYRVEIWEGAAEDCDLYGGPTPPPGPGGLWIRIGQEQALRREGPASVRRAQAEGYGLDELRFLCAKTHYRRPLAASWQELAQARGELLDLREAAKGLQDRFGSAEAHASGLAGYKKRLRDSLAQDLDAAGALRIVWDALRPGALSPGSRLEALREAEKALGLGFLGLRI